jgi:hypothetical protein
MAESEPAAMKREFFNSILDFGTQAPVRKEAGKSRNC